jgi:hypothetical protein
MTIYKVDHAADSDKLGGYELDDTDIADSRVVAYDLASGKLIFAEVPGGSFGNLDGGTPSSNYGGISPIDGGEL